MDFGSSSSVKGLQNQSERYIDDCCDSISNCWCTENGMEVIFAQLNYLANKIKLVPCSRDPFCKSILLYFGWIQVRSFTSPVLVVSVLSQVHLYWFCIHRKYQLLLYFFLSIFFELFFLVQQLLSQS
jgi:hypothetical protein